LKEIEKNLKRKELKKKKKKKKKKRKEKVPPSAPVNALARFKKKLKEILLNATKLQEKINTK